MEEKSKVSSEDKMMAAVGYVWVLFLVPLLAKKDSKFCQFHARQGLVLFIVEVILSIVWIVPVLGWIVGFFGWVATVLLSIMGIINALEGNEWKMPYLAKYADKFKS